MANVSTGGAPIRDGNEIVGIVTVGNDVTEETELVSFQFPPRATRNDDGLGAP
jgi:hypothetical protein